MIKQDLEVVVGKAIRAAAGKSFTQAVSVVVDAVMVQLAIEEAANTFNVVEETPEAQVPASIVAPQKISELVPVTGEEKRPPREVYREYHTVEQIRLMVMEKTPPTITCRPLGYTEDLSLDRFIQVIQADPQCVQLVYRPRTSQIDISFPKRYLWVNEEGWDWDTIITEVRDEANQMYAIRGPANAKVTTMIPVEQRMNNAGTVT